MDGDNLGFFVPFLTEINEAIIPSGVAQFRLSSEDSA